MRERGVRYEKQNAKRKAKEMSAHHFTRGNKANKALV